MNPLFDLTGKVAVVTGGAGLLGLRHCEVLLAAGARVVCLDLHLPEGNAWERLKEKTFGLETAAMTPIAMDITDLHGLQKVVETLHRTTGLVDILVNNACNNPKVEGGYSEEWKVGSLAQWNADLAVGLTGPYLCSQVFGSVMVLRGKGVILNIASELAIIAPDQRLYRKPGLLEHQQPIKPTSYSVVKHGLIGLTKWLATYYAGKGVRVNSLSPGGVENGQDVEWISRYVNTIPLGRMSQPNDYQGAVLFLCSDASAFMTGANLVMDGGRSCW
jgi:NAD(P)-dependent dehydrogenase (short-subunit alcohol dehydrogenase family)